MKYIRLTLVVMGLICTLFYICQINNAYGGEMTDEMKKMQEHLNNQVLSKPFSVADEAQVKAYIEDAQRRGEVPQPYTGKHWRPGYTCYDLRPYSYREYLACRHYYFYYGRYYP
jgi:Na+-translocating ferredoxin:NAD+ oxidoreductase RnfG subunit